MIKKDKIMIQTPEFVRDVQLREIKLNPEYYKPENTSISQISHAIKRSIKDGYVKTGDVVLDYGGGKYDKGVAYYTENGVNCLVYDIYARTYEYNCKTLDILEKLKEQYGVRVSCVILANVLCVIPEPKEREYVIKHAFSFLKKGKSMLITVYEGDKSGFGRVTAKGKTIHWQEHRKTETYMDEISEALNGKKFEIKRKNKLIVVTKI